MRGKRPDDKRRELPRAIVLLLVFAAFYMAIGSAVWWLHKPAHPRAAGHLLLFLAYANRAVPMREGATAILSVTTALLLASAIVSWYHHRDTNAWRVFRGRVMRVASIAGASLIAAVVLALSTDTFA